MNTRSRFADVLLPLPVSAYTYSIPGTLEDKVIVGGRVVVQFGKRKIYTALVLAIHDRKPAEHEIKEILSVLDETPVIHPLQMKFWYWLASYYLCHPGEVMNAALPSAFKLASESKVVLNPDQEPDLSTLNEKESMLIEALLNRKAIEVSEISKIIGQMKVIPVIKTMLEKGLILMEEELHDRFRPRKETYLRITEKYSGNEAAMKDLFDLLEKKARKQMELLMSFMILSKYDTGMNREVSRTELLKSLKVTPAALDGLITKGVLEPYEKRVSRIGEGEKTGDVSSIRLMDFQQKAFDEIHSSFLEKDVVLLHGVTSSGKTELYIKHIQETLDKGLQVLYLLPEIALTTQTISRLKKYFGERVGVYHSRFNENERAEIWNKVLSAGKTGQEGNAYDIVLGARSAVFLPFTKLGLIIVDEEHDSSFKQYDPAPRYNGRDAALYLAHLHQAKTILGSATPSIESYFNSKNGKYGLVEMSERFGNMEMPEIRVVDLRHEIRWKTMKSHFSSVLIQQLQDVLDKGEQAIIFQNRRGFSLRLECETCSWMPSCRNCDVTLVYHKKSSQLRCHYCGFTTFIPEKCPSCKGTVLKMKGFGTEKVEEELQLIFPKARIVRMDLDSTRTRHAHQKIINDLEERKIDILVGTQMVTKGLDLENVSTVSILNADNMLSFPDFRSAERSYQLMAQVSGRSGRKNKRGQVIIQAFNPKHPVILDVVNHDYRAMFEQQLVDRRKFRYPPYYRLVIIKVKHRDPEMLNKAAAELARRLTNVFGNRILGPEYPMVGRIMNYYIKQIMVKTERNFSQAEMKSSLMKALEEFGKLKDFGAFRLVIDVDPQ